MNIKQIRELAHILSQNDLSALEITEGETRIRLERESTGAAPAPAQQISVVVPAAEAEEMPEQTAQRGAGVDFNHLFEVKSPLVGVFYAAPSPDAESFVKIGSTVHKGDVVCIVEAMKLMNEIVAEQDGTVVDICARNGDIVEYGQTLFKLN